MDIIFSEFICVIAWYNPFAWGIRHAIRQNLEFIADQQVLTHGADRRSYQWLLLKVTGHAPIAISNQFNLSFLKNRLIMMNKNKSAKTQLLKFLLMLPILVILLMAFRSAGDSIFPAIIKEALHPGLHVALADTLPPAPPPPVPVVEAPARPPVVTAAPRVAPVPPVIQKGNVKNININNNNRANVELKNGKKEYYNLNNAAEKKAFEKKYGMPAPPPPIVESEIVIANEEAVALPETEVAISEAPQAKVAPVIATAPMVKVTTRAKPVQAVAPMPAIEDESIELEGEMLLNLNAHSTQADIDRQVSKIKSKGYIIEISNVVFMNGRLTMIEGFLSSKKKKNHFRAADFKELYFTESDDKSDDSGFRFYIVKGQLSVN